MTTDGTQNKQDSSAEKQDSSGANEGTSEEQLATFTEEQQKVVDATVRKAVDDALSQAGRDVKAVESLRETVQAQIDQLASDRATWLKQQREAELDGADPDQVDSIKEKHQLQEKVDDLTAQLTKLTAQNTENETKLEKYRDTEVLGMFMVVASRYGLDATELQTASNELGLVEESKIDGLAQRMKAASTLKVDSSKTSGGDVSSSKKPETPRDKITAGLAKERQQKR